MLLVTTIVCLDVACDNKSVFRLACEKMTTIVCLDAACDNKRVFRLACENDHMFRCSL